ncbi:hypothetical protein NC653_015375 [Populus alba x Populus x berolinensis]|uniref:X8 domain-containing protein n=1 Tax=Populus alba x Populus x berolinensis TaxID=444605 RepID=A0AAD6QKD5_9ROSI|nr:hypothetical protein NC653_015375 [Populus alba x Populus x berolinensis]
MHMPSQKLKSTLLEVELKKSGSTSLEGQLDPVHQEPVGKKEARQEFRKWNRLIASCSLLFSLLHQYKSSCCPHDKRLKARTKSELFVVIMSFHFKGSDTSFLSRCHQIFPGLFIALSSPCFNVCKKQRVNLRNRCIADEQTQMMSLQSGHGSWACGEGRCRLAARFQMNQPCYIPNTNKGSRSYAFNDYYQKVCA